VYEGKKTYDEILVRLVRWLTLLLPCAHEPPPRHDALLNLWQMHLHHHPLLARIAVAHFCDAVAGATDFEEDLALHVLLRRRDLQLRVLHVLRRAAREVRLVLFALRMCEVRALVCMQGQA